MILEITMQKGRGISVLIIAALGLVASVATLAIANPTVSVQTATPVEHASTTATWHVSVSANCNNRAVCSGESFLGQPFTVGGLWGSMELGPGGAGRAEFTACSRPTSGPTRHDVVIHVSVQITGWTIGSSGTFVILSGSEEVRGGVDAGSVLPIQGPVDTGILAMPGHYTSLLNPGGAVSAGVHAEIQVTELVNA